MLHSYSTPQERIRDRLLDGLLEERDILEQRIRFLERKLAAHHEISMVETHYPGARIGDKCPVCLRFDSGPEKVEDASPV